MQTHTIAIPNIILISGTGQTWGHISLQFCPIVKRINLPS